MISTIQTLVSLLAVIAVVGVVASRLKIPSAILLVLVGVLLAIVPDLPTVELAPQLVLMLILPPVIYSAAVAMSWANSSSISAPSRYWRSVVWHSRRSRSPLRRICYWVSSGRWVL